MKTIGCAAIVYLRTWRLHFRCTRLADRRRARCASV